MGLLAGMPDPAPHTDPWAADAFLRAMEDTLRGLVTGLGGVLDVATDPDHALELLQTTPARWRAILGWPGYGDHPEALHGVATERVYVIVQAAKGLPMRAGDLLHREGRMGEPLMGLIESVSKWMRAMRFPAGSGHDPKGFALTGSAWLSDIEGVETKQHQLDFSVVCALPVHPTSIVVSTPSLTP